MIVYRALNKILAYIKACLIILASFTQVKSGQGSLIIFLFSQSLLIDPVTALFHGTCIHFDSLLFACISFLIL